VLIDAFLRKSLKQQKAIKNYLISCIDRFLTGSFLFSPWCFGAISAPSVNCWPIRKSSIKLSNQPLGLDRDLKFNPSLNHGFLTYLDEISERNSPGNSPASCIISIKANGDLTQSKYPGLMEILISVQPPHAVTQFS
jgi:hypothetical protein